MNAAVTHTSEKKTEAKTSGKRGGHEDQIAVIWSQAKDV